MNGKRLSGLLALCLLLGLTACGGGGESSSPGDGSEPPSVSTLAPVEEPDRSQEPEEPVYPYAAPLTGEGLTEDVSGRRPIAIMLNNLSKALPQAGVAQADVIYEIVAEGGITRGWGRSAPSAPPGTTTSPWPMATTPFSSTPGAAPRPMT